MDWQDGGCCCFIPVVADLGVEGSSGCSWNTSDYFVRLYPFYRNCFGFSNTGEDLFRKLLVAIAV